MVYAAYDPELIEQLAARAAALQARERYTKLGKPRQVAEIDAWLQAR